jgi:tetratricopeptide (TPR) repeat protein
MKCWPVLLTCLLLTACASAPPSAAPPALFHDALFEPPAQPVQAEAIFALSDEMKHYVDTELASQLRHKGMQRGLMEALYAKRQLKLEYNADRTRNATEAFEARAGNCLSLVIMTAAIAKHLGLQVSYQSVYVDDIWSRNQDLYFASGHVNLVLGQRPIDATSRGTISTWTIDFLPPEDLRGQRSREVGESTIVAMYMNNRAAESLAAGELNDAYAWARAALTHEPGFLSAYNTLGVVYLRHGQAAAADTVFAHVLQRAPTNTVAMANRVRTLGELGRADEAAALADHLARLDPEPPYHFFERGQAAMRAGDHRAARDWFAKETARAPYNPEFHFWLAVADFRLGELDEARKHLALAMQSSTTRSDRQLYAAKLAQLKRLRLQ